MIEPYQWLMFHFEEYGYNPANVGPASVDLTLGALKPETIRRGDKLVLYPGQFFLGSTAEYIRVPDTHCAMIQMRSSLARRGLGHKMAGFVDPGFEGQITLELETAQVMETFLGERIVQLIYIRLTEPTQKLYRGRYQGQQGPTEAYQ
jgi:dCTP deaminase